MFGRWGKKPAETTESESPTGRGFFSTDTPLRKLTPANIPELLKQSFQRTVNLKQAIGSKGETVAFAMDSSIQEQKLLDGNSNPNIPTMQVAWYASQGFIGYQTCALLAQNPWIDKACWMPAKDAARNGYEITVNSGDKIKPEILDAIAQGDKKFRILQNCVELEGFKRVFGIRVVMFLVESNDPDYYEKPFNPDGVTPYSYRGFSQIDPYWITPELSMDAASNPSSPDFYTPTWWRINGKRVHRSHLVVVTNGQVADILKPTYLYGGISVPQKIAERVYAAERSANEVPMLLMTKRMTVINLDMVQATMNQKEFLERMEIWSQYMNNFGVKVIGQGEEVSQHETSLADADNAVMQQFGLVASSAEIPLTKYLGTSPKGMDATGEFEMKDYLQTLESMQEGDMTPFVNRHHLLYIRSEICPRFNVKPFNVDVEWEEPDMQTAKEQAEINDKKADTDTKLANAGAIDGVDIRNRLINDKKSGYNGLQPIEEDLNAGEDENPDDNPNFGKEQNAGQPKASDNEENTDEK